MADQKPISFEDMMAASEPPASSPFAAPDLTPVRYFTTDGLDEVAKLLKTIRTDKTLHRDEVEDLLDDPQYAKPLDPEGVPVQHAIDRKQVFATKLELCEYFTSIFDDVFLETNRKNAGLWTWLALAYYSQFVKTKKEVVELASTPRWIFDPENYRLSVRHFVAGALYLFYDFHDTGSEVKDLLFSSSPKEFGGFVDAITYKMEGSRLPVLMQVAAWLYYDPSSPKRMKKGVISQDKPGTVREFLRVASQLAMTRDFYGVNDAAEMWNVLPKQFDGFKGNEEH